MIFEKFTSRTQNEFHLSYHCHQAIAGKAVDEGVSFYFHCFYLFVLLLFCFENFERGGILSQIGWSSWVLQKH